MTRAALVAILTLLVAGCGRYGPPVRTPPHPPAPAAAPEATPAVQPPQPTAQTPGPDSEAPETDAEEGEE